MSFKEKLNKETVSAAKIQVRLRLSALRMLKSALHNREIELKRELQEAEFLQLIASMVKQRKDSIEQFAKGGRHDLVEKEEAELKVIEDFLPAQLSEADVDVAINAAIEEAGAVSIRDIGKVMGILMPKVMGKADGKTVGEKIRARLSA